MGKCFQKYKSKRNDTLTKSPTMCKNKILVLDEAHNLRTETKISKGNLLGKQARIIIDCAKLAWKVIALTATTVVNNPYDIVNLVSIVKGVEPIKPREFENILKSPQETYKYLSCLISFYSREDTDVDYPRSKETDVDIEMDRKFYDNYMKIENAQIGDFGGYLSSDKVWVFLNGVRRATNISEMRSGKIEWVIKKVIGDQRSTLIYSSWLTSGKNILTDEFKKYGITYAEVDGTMSKQKRDESVKKINNGDVQVLLISKAGGEGLDLKGIRTVIMLDPVWNEASEQQIKGRAVRYKSHTHLPESERSVEIYNLFMMKPPHGKKDRKGIIRAYEDILKSADDLMRDNVKKKTEKLNRFIDILKELSIEHDKHCH